MAFNSHDWKLVQINGYKLRNSLSLSAIDQTHEADALCEISFAGSFATAPQINISHTETWLWIKMHSNTYKSREAGEMIKRHMANHQRKCKRNAMSEQRCHLAFDSTYNQSISISSPLKDKQFQSINISSLFANLYVKQEEKNYLEMG